MIVDVAWIDGAMARIVICVASWRSNVAGSKVSAGLEWRQGIRIDGIGSTVRLSLREEIGEVS